MPTTTCMPSGPCSTDIRNSSKAPASGGIPQHVQRMALAGQPVVKRAQYQRAAMARDALAQLGFAHPQRAHDAGIEFRLVTKRFGRAAECEANIGDVLRHQAPLVYTDQRSRLENVRRLLAHL